MARQGLAIAGGAIGMYFGGPAGAQLGMALGGMLGGMIDPEKIPGPKLGTVPLQTGRVGVPIPVGWGLDHTMGNILQKNEIVEVEEEESQGKGGGATVTTTVRYRTFAIGVMRSITGEIAGIVRIWENDKLVYDTRASPAIPTEDTQDFADGIRIYLGDEAQLPDPDLEAEKGVGNQVPYRGLPYVVFVDKNISDFGSAIPQYRFEVLTGADLSVTSEPYPIEVVEGITSSHTPGRQAITHKISEGLGGSFTPLDGTLTGPLKSYSDWPPEGIEPTMTPLDGDLTVRLHVYEDWPPEGVEATMTPLDGDLTPRLVPYTNWPPEGLEATITPQNGTLS